MRPYLLGLLALLGCGGGGGGGSPEPDLNVRPEVCAGNRFVEAMNDWSRAVEIYAVGEDGNLGSVLASVPAGTTREILLPRDAATARAMLPTLTGPVEVPSRARARVRLRFLCR